MSSSVWEVRRSPLSLALSPQAGRGNQKRGIRVRTLSCRAGRSTSPIRSPRPRLRGRGPGRGGGDATWDGEIAGWAAIPNELVGLGGTPLTPLPGPLPASGAREPEKGIRVRTLSCRAGRSTSPIRFPRPRLRGRGPGRGGGDATWDGEIAGWAAIPNELVALGGTPLTPLPGPLPASGAREPEKGDQGAYTFMSGGEEHISDPVPSPPSAGERARERGRSMPPGMEK